MEAGPQAIRGRPGGGPTRKAQGPASVSLGETGNIARLVSILVEHEREHAAEILEMLSARQGDDEDEDEDQYEYEDEYIDEDEEAVY